MRRSLLDPVAGRGGADYRFDAGLLDSPEIAALVSELEATRWTGRPGYPLRGMIGMALVKKHLRRANVDPNGRARP